MRHLGSIVVTLVVAPLVLVLAGRGLTGFVGAAAAERADYIAITFAVAELALAGMGLALLTMARYSPLGPVLAGLGYLSLASWSLADRTAFLTTVQGELIGLDRDQLATAAAVAPLFAVPLLLTVFNVRRWRGHDLPGPAVAAADYGVRDTQEMPVQPPAYPGAPGATAYLEPMPYPQSAPPSPMYPPSAPPSPMYAPPAYPSSPPPMSYPPPPMSYPPPTVPGYPQPTPPAAGEAAGDEPTDVLPSDQTTARLNHPPPRA